MRAASLALGFLATLVVATPAMAQEQQQPASRPTVATANDKVLIQRGQEFLPAMPNMALQDKDKIVVLEGGTADVTCDGDSVGNYTETGIYPVPSCDRRVAAVPEAAAQPAQRVVVTEAAGATNWGSVAAVAGGVLLVAIASTSSRDGGPPPVSP
jgi:hypothetical protein